MRNALPCLAALCFAALPACAPPARHLPCGPTEPAPTAAPKPADRAALERQVADTERAFAKTMADRDLAAFSSFLSEETVFFSGPEPLRGKQAVTAWWKRQEAPGVWRIIFDKGGPCPEE